MSGCRTKDAYRLVLMLGGCAAALAGCATTLDVRRQAGLGQYSEGVVQVLPFTQYEVTATWRLAGCDIETPQDNVDLAVTAVAQAQDDPEQRYLIDATSLQGPLTRAQFSVGYHEGSNTLKTVNAEVEDRTAAFAGNVIGTAARVFTGVPPVSLESRDDSRSAAPSVCTAEAEEALSRVVALEGELDDANAAVAAASDEVARLGAIIARLGSLADPGTTSAFADAIEDLESRVAAQSALAGQLNSALGAVSVSRVVRWPDNGRQFNRDDALTIPQDALTAWFGADQQPAAWPASFLAIRPSNGSAPIAVSSEGQAPAAGRVAGIPYRINVRGRLISCAVPCAQADAGRQRTVVEGTVAQLGGVAVLPVRNPPLGSSAFAAEFNRDGTLVSAGFEQRRAPLEEASAIMSSSTAALAPLLDPTQRLQRETAYLQALQERRAAAEALRPSRPSTAEREAATVSAENTLLEAQITNLEARITLQELQGRLGSR